MKSKAMTLALSLAAAGALLAAPAGAQQMPDPETVNGQVVDLTCYVNMGLHGEDHKMCAEVCAKKGLPLGLLGSDGQIYLLSGQGMPAADITEDLIPHAEEQVAVTGPVIKRSGARSIVVQKIESAG